MAKLQFLGRVRPEINTKKSGPPGATNQKPTIMKLSRNYSQFLADIFGIRNLPLKFHDKCKA